MRIVVTLLLLLVSAPTQASVIYTYVGNPFTDIVDLPFPVGTFQTSMRVAGWFELANPLSADLPMTDIATDVLRFSFSDGRNTLTEASPEVGRFFFVKTDGSGRLSDWLIIADQTSRASLSDPQVLIQLSNDPQGLALGAPSVQDLGQLAMCDPQNVPRGLCINLADRASVDARPGVWSSSDTPVSNVPEPASLGLLLMGLAMWVRARGRQAA